MAKSCASKLRVISMLTWVHVHASRIVTGLLITVDVNIREGKRTCFQESAISVSAYEACDEHVRNSPAQQRKRLCLLRFPRSKPTNLHVAF
jgi:hypothetical protein